MPNIEHLISGAQAADRLGINRATFNRWVAAGRISPAFTVPGDTGARFYDPADVQRLKDEAGAA